jgi:tetratricopeptide (TPR) repeat protein
LFNQATAQTINVTQAPQIDVGLVRLVAESQGYLSPERARALEEQVARTQADLERLRRDNPDWAADVDAAIAAFNASDPDAAREAFARIDALIDERRAALLAEEATLRLEAARSKHAQATLLYLFEASKAEPLLTAAAELAATNVWYWIECGRARKHLGNLNTALEAYARAERIARDAPAPRDRAAALDGTGDVFTAQGDLQAARAAFDESLSIVRNLAARDPGNAGWARDVSVSLNKLGDVAVAQGDLSAARAAYAEDLEIARTLAARDPGNAAWARDVLVSLVKLGDLFVAEGDLPAARAAFDEGLAIARALAARDPGNAGWARDVSVSLEKLGDVAIAAGDLQAARAAYDESLAIARDLAARDPGNAGWARDLAVSLEKLGDLAIAAGDLRAARAAFDESLRIRRALAARDPGNAGWARDVWVALWRMTQVDPENAADHWAEVVARLEDMDARGILLPSDAWMLDDARANLAAARERTGE